MFSFLSLEEFLFLDNCRQDFFNKPTTLFSATAIPEKPKLSLATTGKHRVSEAQRVPEKRFNGLDCAMKINQKGTAVRQHIIQLPPLSSINIVKEMSNLFIDYKHYKLAIEPNDKTIYQTESIK